MGDLEDVESRQRVITEEQFMKKRQTEAIQGKYDRIGMKVERTGQEKLIDSTQEFGPVLELIQAQSWDESAKDEHLPIDL